MVLLKTNKYLTMVVHE